MNALKIIITDEWNISLIIRSGVRGITNKSTIRLLIRSCVKRRGIASKWTIRLIIYLFI